MLFVCFECFFFYFSIAKPFKMLRWFASWHSDLCLPYICMRVSVCVVCVISFRQVRAVSDFHRRARLCAALNSTARAVSVKCRSHRSSSKSPSSSSSSSSSSYSPPISAPTFPYQSELEAHGAIKGGSCSFDGVFLATGGCASRVLRYAALVLRSMNQYLHQTKTIFKILQ